MSSMPSRQGHVVFEFGDFRLDADQRQLLCISSGLVVPLLSRAFDTLLHLVQHPGELVGKEALMRAVWPDTVVEDNNLSQSIAAIRRALGERPGEHKYIVTIPGRGFRFVSQVRRLTEASTRQPPGTPAMDALPSESPAPGGGRAGKPARHRRVVAIAGAVAVAVAVAGYVLLPQRAAQSQVRTLAVLPFKPIDPTDADRSLQYGMTDTLISRLSSLGGVAVQPFSSVRRFGDPDQDARSAGRELGVASVLDGTIQRNGDRVRVSASLIEVESGRQLWSDQFLEDFTDIFSVQDAIAARVANALAVRLTGTERRQLTHRYTNDAEAYQLYVSGWFQRSRSDADGFRRSIDFFNRAIARDPAYPLPYVGLADSYAMLAVFGIVAPNDAFAPALAAANKALELDSELGEAHASLAHIKIQFEHDHETARREYQRALSIAPRYAVAHMWYGLFLAWSGEFDQALASLRHAQQLEPLQLGTSANIGMILYFARRYDAAIEHLHRVLEMAPGMDHARSWLGRAYMRKGDYDRAIREFRMRKSLSVQSYSDLAAAYALAGRRPEALAELERLMQLSRERYVSAYDIAAIHVSVGNPDEAFAWLDRAIEERAMPLVVLRFDPAFDRIRDDPRMAIVMARLTPSAGSAGSLE
jgi:TolB-like protein/DNA-binding winged helix-turn-helix (wHTH) protein/Tfp pilus assembly protein PilF